jgi:DNA (cytosine-5)-methyltransferase 1
VTAYYNEIDPYAAQWLRNLIAAGHIARGDVDERSIVDVRAAELAGYAQCHFFAGVGGWSLALRLARWPDDRPVWTGSCPCQPFSAAGKGEAFNDNRYLWPAWLPLIAQCRPPIVFGEQVEAAIGWGWLDTVLTDLEQEGYAVGTAVLPACGVGAPHIRQRLWFVADADGGHASTEGESRELGDADRARLSPRECGELSGPQREDERRTIEQPSCSPWAAAQWLPCTDGKARPVEPGTFPLADGVSARVGRLRAYGNAIIPQVAAEFIRACS